MDQAIAVKNAFAMMVKVEVNKRKSVLRVSFADEVAGEVSVDSIKAQGELDLERCAWIRPTIYALDIKLARVTLTSRGTTCARCVILDLRGRNAHFATKWAADWVNASWVIARRWGCLRNNLPIRLASAA